MFVCWLFTCGLSLTMAIFPVLALTGAPLDEFWAERPLYNLEDPSNNHFDLVRSAVEKSGQAYYCPYQ